MSGDPMEDPEKSEAYRQSIIDMMKETIAQDREKRRNAPVVERPPVIIGADGFGGIVNGVPQ